MSETSSAQRDDAAVARFIERFALDLTAAGVPRMPARVFAGLLATDAGSMTAADLADLLQVSPASISGAVRHLAQVGMVVREREPGSRRDHYALRDDFWFEVIDRRNEVLREWQDAMGHGIRAVGAGTPAGARMAEAEAFFGFLHEELPAVLDKWHDRRAELRDGWARTR